MTERRPARLVAWLAFVAAWSTLAYAAQAVGDDQAPRDLFYRYETAVLGAVMGAFIGGVALLFAGAGGAPTRELLGLRRPRSWWVAAGVALLVLIATFVVAGVVAALGFDPTAEQGLLPERWRPERAVPYAANFVAVAGIAPVIEELMFRGVGFSLLRPWGAALTVIVVGLAFAAAHGLVEAFPIIATLGIGLAVLRNVSGSVYPPIALHAAFNAISMIAIVFRPEA